MRFFSLDTPGVLNPVAQTLEDTMKLGLCETVLDSIVRKEYLADYLLFYLNSYATDLKLYVRFLTLIC